MKSLIASAVGYGVDGFDNLMIGFALAAISGSLGLTTTQAGSLATVTLVGAVLGGVGFGIAADYLGRVRTLTWSIIAFAVFTGLTAIAQDYNQLVVFRFLAGIGLGGEFGVGMALAAEAWPAARRAQATSWVGVGGQIGPLLGVLVAGPVLAVWGWRVLFVVGALPALLAFAMRRTLHEPDKFVESRAARKDGARSPLRLLVADRRTAVVSLAILVLCSVQTFGYYGIMTWLPTYLAEKVHFSVSKSGVWTAVTIAGMAIGMIVFGKLADRIGRRRSFWIFQAGAIVSVLIYVQLTTPALLLVGGAVLGVFVNGMLGGYGALMAELYPTAARATAQNVLFNLGRAVGGLAPIIFALIAQSHGLGMAIGMLAVLYLLDMVAVLFIPERRGAELT
ncbi:MFS transporter [Nonomuraea angiospora]|uniref:MFS transporter n=1 Tax=Nonomuraea angiospora TaxID=46172 RepID=UPI0029A45895|nr:MFS transporter [Nonomuraea angiospora]MDX3107936.1 MFS transporter [Nonomuraea angiospora]